MAKLIHAATRDGAELVEFAVKVLRGEADPDLCDSKSRRWAADWLSDRGFGRPMQTVELTGVERPINLAPMTEAQLEALAELDAATEIDAAEQVTEGDAPDPN